MNGSGIALLWLALAGIADPVPAPSPQPVVSKWQLDYAPTACRLLATFGTDRDTLVFAQANPRAPMQLTAVSTDWPATNVSRKVGVMLDGVQPILMLYSVGLPSSGPARYLYLDLATGLRELMESTRSTAQPPALIVTSGGKVRSYAIGKTGPLLAALDRCTDDLVRSWGFDAAEQRAATPPEATTPPAGWLTPNDYPPMALANNIGGGVDLRLDVDPTGHVTECHVMEAGGDPTFRDHSCKLLRERALYRPAKNAAGTPIASYAIHRVRWSPPPRG